MLALSQTDKTTDQGILTDYFSAIASASKLPLIVQVTSPALTVDYLIGLAKKLPTFRYVKEEQKPVPPRVDRYVREAKGLLTPMTGGGSRNLLNEMARGSCGTMPGAGFADIQALDLGLVRFGGQKTGPRTVRENADDGRAGRTHRLRLAKGNSPAARHFQDRANAWRQKAFHGRRGPAGIGCGIRSAASVFPRVTLLPIFRKRPRQQLDW